MEKRGIPTGTFCTDEFGSLGRVEAEALGIPTLPLVSFPHPLGGLRKEEVKGMADTALEEVLHALTEKRENLAKEYRGRYPQPKSMFKPKPIFE